MKYCPNCGEPFEAGQKFCGNCGQKLPAEIVLPAEPVYTDDPALLNNPVLNRPDELSPKPREEKVPELTLEPDLWGLGAAATAAAAAEAAAPAEAASAAQAAPAEPPSFASVMEGIEYERDEPAPQDTGEYHGQGVGATEYSGAQSTAGAAQSSASSQSYDIPNDYTMSMDEGQSAGKLPDETLMLVWSIILTAMCNIPGIVGLVKTVKARKTFDFGLKRKLLQSAKIWLIIGTAFYALGFLGNLF